MKKLTKTLSLVLVVAMVLSLCVIGAGATFTDNSKVTTDYNEAVGIMTDLAVVKGYPDGSFKPAGTLTRAEACVIMANMTLGTTAAAALAPSTVSFKDVPTTYWGYKYVEYCYQCGYIAGTGNGNFTPGATLTGYQWALMLMRILGYDMTSLTTGNWQINTAKVYYAADTSFSDVAISGAAMTREAAAQMAYDVLFKATGATEGYALRLYAVATTKASTDAIVGYYDTAVEAANAANLYNALSHQAAGVVGSYYSDTSVSAIKDGTSLASSVFGVYKNATGTATQDVFGRPANVYTTKTKAEATAYGWTADTYSTRAKAVNKTPILTYTSAVTGGKLYTDLGKVTPTSLTVYLNGYTYTSLTTAKVVSGNTNSYGGNGTVIEVYKTGTGAYTIVAVSTVPGVIKSHVAAVKDANGDISTKEYVTVGYGSNASNTYKFETTAFTDADAKAGTVVICTFTTTDGTATVSAVTVRSVKAAATASVIATSSTDSAVGVNNMTFVSDGKAYKYNENAASFISAADVTNKTSKVVYLDDNGYVVAVADPTNSANLAVVLAYSPAGSLDGYTYNVRLLLADGTVKDVVATKGTSNSAVGVKGAYEVNEIVTYTVNSTGKYVLTDAGTAVAGVYAPAITTGTVAFSAGNNGSDAVKTDNKANAKTLFFVVTYASDGTPTYKVYTGISSVPSIDGFKVPTGSTGASDVFTATGATYASAVLVNGAKLTSDSTTSKDVIYVTTKGAVPMTDATLGSYVVYHAVVNGTVTTVNAASGLFTADGIYTAVTKNTNGVITAAIPMTDSAVNVTPVIKYVTGALGTTAESSGIVKLNTAELTYADSTTVYYVAADGTITTSAVGSIKTDTTDTAIYYTTNGVLTSAFITSVTGD